MNRPPRAAATTAAVPSPPSAIGLETVDTSGHRCRSPHAIACAASNWVSDPLNESGASTIDTHLTDLPSRRI